LSLGPTTNFSGVGSSEVIQYNISIQTVSVDDKFPRNRIRVDSSLSRNIEFVDVLRELSTSTGFSSGRKLRESVDNVGSLRLSVVCGVPIVSGCPNATSVITERRK